MEFWGPKAANILLERFFVLKKVQIDLYSETTIEKRKLPLKRYLSLLDGKAVLITAPGTEAFSFCDNILKAEVSTHNLVLC